MDQADWALIKPEKEITPEIEVREDGATIRNGKIRAEINLIGKIAFYNQKGELYWMSMSATEKICSEIPAVLLK